MSPWAHVALGSPYLASVRVWIAASVPAFPQVEWSQLLWAYPTEGNVGTGEARLWARHPTVYCALKELGEYYLCRAPTPMELNYQVTARNTRFMGAALNTMDVAM